MRLTPTERETVEMLRKLDDQQRSEVVRELRAQVEANKVIAQRLRGRRLKIPADKKIEKAFGAAPIWRMGKKKA